MKKRMMILGAGPLQIPAIKKAKDLGYEIISVDYDENAAGFSLADIKLVVSTLDQEEVLRQAQIHRPDVVITSTSDGPVRTAAYVNEKLGKQPDLSYEDSICATVKSHMRDRLKKYGVPIPAYYAADNFCKFKTAVELFANFCIVKPADNAGSRGVVLIDDKIPLTEEKLISIYEYSKDNSRNGIVMVEEFMTGAEVSVEAVTVNGETEVITITDKFITPPPYFVELAHSQPSRLPEEVLERIREITKQAVAAIHLINGPSHTEVKVTETGPKIVELAARLGGDFITSRLVPLSTGVDMAGNSVILAAGGKIDVARKWNKGAAIRFIQGAEGIIESISMDAELDRMKGVEEVVIYKNKGDKVNGVKSSNDRLGHVIACGETAEEAMTIAQEALSYIRISVV